MGETNDLTVGEAQKRVKDLEEKLRAAREDLKQVDVDASTTNESSKPSGHNDCVVLDGSERNTKRGYLFKWQDRVIGWTGTKWSLRFVVLQNGRLAYYRTHKDITARYVLVLKNCAVSDDGVKTNPRSGVLSTMGFNSSEEHFHRFSIYQRRSDATTEDNNNEDDIVPLLRFSTSSLAEKMQWIEFISEACAYCDSDHFHQRRFDDLNQSVYLDQLPASKPLKVEPGKLAPISQNTGRLVKLQPSSPRKKNRPKIYRRKSQLNKRSLHTYTPSRPMHRSADPSYLSEEAQSQNFRGLFNLALIVLVISNFNFLYDTIRKYGLIFSKSPDFSGYTEAPLEQFPFFTGIILLPFFVLYAYIIEVQLSKRFIDEPVGVFLHLTNAHLALLIPAAIVWFFVSNPLVGAALVLTATITYMKLVSYALANADYRISEHCSYQATLALISDLDEDATDLSYPGNVTFSNILYFWMAPTLTYQMAYPISPRIRWHKVITLILRMIIASALLLFMALQVVAPNIEFLIVNYRKHGLSTSLCAEYLTKLAISCTYCWLLFFYLYFHLLLNLLAEVLRFGDRVFYEDWWNASEVSSYWRLWNKPVHYWLIRHVYFPCLRKGMSKNMSMVAVFFFSAVLHEVLISVPFHILSLWSFWGMMGQLPLIFFTKYLDKMFQGTSYGNIIFWLSFCILGQPIAILLYTMDYLEKENESVNQTEVSMNIIANMTKTIVDRMLPCRGPECEL